jgi:hypothetical protein
MTISHGKSTGHKQKKLIYYIMLTVRDAEGGGLLLEPPQVRGLVGTKIFL